MEIAVLRFDIKLISKMKLFNQFLISTGVIISLIKGVAITYATIKKKKVVISDVKLPVKVLMFVS